MKTSTSPLFQFLIIAALLTLIFRFSLTSMLEARENALIWITPGVYAILMHVAGWWCGKKYKLHLPIKDIGFKLHLLTFIVFAMVSEDGSL